jgi:hypothetical protein
MYNYVKQHIIVHSIIQKLKNKLTFLKNIQTEKAEEPLILTEREETKTRYFPPYSGLSGKFRRPVWSGQETDMPVQLSPKK